jgi:hypothetical protein
MGSPAAPIAAGKACCSPDYLNRAFAPAAVAYACSGFRAARATSWHGRQIDSTVAEQCAVSFSPYLGPRLLLRILLAVAGIGRGRAQANRAEVRADLLERFSLPIGLGPVGLALVGTLFRLRPGTGRCGNRLFACLPSFVTASSLSRCSLWTLWLLFFSLRSIAPVFTTTGNAPGK